MGVSLVIANRNNAHFLRECLISALGQSLPFEEVIVVDDASDDDSLEVIRSFASGERRLRLVSLDHRVGVSCARHSGIELASSTHVTTLDADDFFWSCEKNEREWELIVASAGAARPVIAFSDIRRVTADGVDLGSVAARRTVKQGDIFRWLLGLYGFVPRDFTMARSDYFAAGGYDTAFDLYEDWDLKLRLARRCDFRFTGSDGVAYRANPAGLSRAAFGRHFMAMRRIAWKNTCHLPGGLRSLIHMHLLWRIAWFHRGRLKTLMLSGRRTTS